MTILQMRTCYILTLLSDMIRGTSSLKALFEKLDTKEVTDRLGEADACCMGGHDTVCRVWTSCFNDLMLDQPLNIGQILKTSGVRPVTTAAKKLQATTPGTEKLQNAGNKPEDAGLTSESTAMFTVQGLFEFGSSEDVPSADMLRCLRLAIAEKLLRKASEVERHLRERLSAHVSLTDDGKGRAKTQSEIVLRLKDECPRVAAAGNPDMMMFKVDKNIKLMFFGEVCILAARWATMRTAIDLNNGGLDKQKLRRVHHGHDETRKDCHPSAPGRHGGWQQIRHGCNLS